MCTRGSISLTANWSLDTDQSKDLFHVVKYVKPCTSGMEAPLRREDKQSWKSFIIYNLNYVMYFPAKTGLDSPSPMMSKCVTEYRFGS